MNELHFQLIFLLTFALSLTASIFKNSLLLFFGLLTIIASIFMKKRVYTIISIFLVLLSAFIYYITSFNSYELLLFFMPIFVIFLIVCLLFLVIYRYIFPLHVYGEVIATDSKNKYCIVDLAFDFVSGIKPGKYAVKTEKNLKIKEKVKLKIKQRLFALPDLVLVDE